MITVNAPLGRAKKHGSSTGEESTSGEESTRKCAGLAAVIGAHEDGLRKGVHPPCLFCAASTIEYAHSTTLGAQVQRRECIFSGTVRGSDASHCSRSRCSWRGLSPIFMRPAPVRNPRRWRAGPSSRRRQRNLVLLPIVTTSVALFAGRWRWPVRWLFRKGRCLPFQSLPLGASCPIARAGSQLASRPPPSRLAALPHRLRSDGAGLA